MGTLYVVATPIGNLEDITFRALRTLQDADVIFAEDTRVAMKLFKRHGVRTLLKSYHQRSRKGVGDEIIALLREGGRVALVVDAGTPGVSDPGNELIGRVREEAPETRIEPIPGPSALTAALSIAGMPMDEFIFLGFLPHKKGRQTLLDEIEKSDRAIILFESPHRIKKLMRELAVRCPTRRAIVVRELTKVFESIVSGTVAELSEKMNRGGILARGEFVVMIARP